jgi:uncharacterized protein (DUF2267 family)
MDYETFERKVGERAGVSREQAGELIRATLETLADRVTAGEAHDVASQLPQPAKECLRDGAADLVRPVVLVNRQVFQR